MKVTSETFNNTLDFSTSALDILRNISAVARACSSVLVSEHTKDRKNSINALEKSLEAVSDKDLAELELTLNDLDETVGGVDNYIHHKKLATFYGSVFDKKSVGNLIGAFAKAKASYGSVKTKGTSKSPVTRFLNSLKTTQNSIKEFSPVAEIQHSAYLLHEVARSLRALEELIKYQYLMDGYKLENPRVRIDFNTKGHSEYAIEDKDTGKIYPYVASIRADDAIEMGSLLAGLREHKKRTDMAKLHKFHNEIASVWTDFHDIYTDAGTDALYMIYKLSESILESENSGHKVSFNVQSKAPADVAWLVGATEQMSTGHEWVDYMDFWQERVRLARAPSRHMS